MIGFSNLSQESFDTLLAAITAATDTNTLKLFLKSVNGTQYVRAGIKRVIAIAKVQRNREVFDICVDAMEEYTRKNDIPFVRAQVEALF